MVEQLMRIVDEIEARNVVYSSEGNMEYLRNHDSILGIFRKEHARNVMLATYIREEARGNLWHLWRLRI